MSRTGNTIYLLRRYVKKQGIAPTRLAEMAGLHPNTLRRMHDDSWNPTSKTLKALEDLMQRESEEAA